MFTFWHSLIMFCVYLQGETFSFIDCFFFKCVILKKQVKETRHIAGNHNESGRNVVAKWLEGFNKLEFVTLFISFVCLFCQRVCFLFLVNVQNVVHFLENNVQKVNGSLGLQRTMILCFIHLFHSFCWPLLN